jgi:hypothetical protein
MLLTRLKTACFAISLVLLVACRGDSTGPGTVSSEEAFQSLARGLSSSSGGLPVALSRSALGRAAGDLSQIDVIIDGARYNMYALGLRVTYPPGTCLESFVIIDHADWLTECTPPPLALVLVLWQTTSGLRPPDQMVFLSADIGTTQFGILPGDGDFTFNPAFAMYANDRQEFWVSAAGSLTSQVTVTTETCSVTPPPFAKTSTCHVATFDESGQITFERFDLVTFGPGTAPARQTMELVIPRQTIRGILQAITETQPVTIPGPWDY